MESTLRCNRQQGHYCRAPLTERAVVTTCSHVFCLNCANELGLADATADSRQCPTCGSGLPNTDDAVTAYLKPTEDYKTSVLSGLDPNTIVECAGRALAFWTYQTSQEIYYHEFMTKNLTEKYSILSNQMDKMISDANAEVQGLNNRIGALQIDQKSIQQKNAELIDMYREKNKKHTQTQHLYDTLKKKVMHSQMHTAASTSLSQTLQSIGSVRPETYTGPAMKASNAPKAVLGRSRLVDFNAAEQGSLGELRQHRGSKSGSETSADAQAMPPPGRPIPGYTNQPFIDTTPMHRTQLPGTSRGSANRSQIPRSAIRPGFQGGSLNPPGSGQRNLMTGSSQSNRYGQGSSQGYGLSAGMKVGRVGTSGLTNQLEPRADQYGGIHDGNRVQVNGISPRNSLQMQPSGRFYR